MNNTIENENESILGNVEVTWARERSDDELLSYIEDRNALLDDTLLDDLMV